MTKTILCIFLFLFALSLFAQQGPIVKFYMNNGSFKKFNITDIDNIGLIKSKTPAIITVYNKVQSLNLSFETNTLEQILFTDNQHIQIVLDTKTYTYSLDEIDSITVKGKPAPIITSINPASGKTGDIITLSGSNFGVLQSVVTFTGSDASEYQSWNDTEIKVKIPNTAYSGKVSISVSGQQSNEIDFSVIPQITSITSAALFHDDEITISGSGFGSIQGTSKVSFGEINASVYTGWNTNEIKVKVPIDALSGKLSVTVGAGRSNEVDYSIKPSISGIVPSSANVGDEVIISGSSFDKQQGNSLVNINGKNIAEYSGWTDTQIKIKIPDNVSSGKLSVTVGGFKSNEINFTLIPQITQLIPASAKVGEEISITGIGFGDAQDTSFVEFAATKATNYSLWSPTLIKVTIPENTTTGKVTVTVSNNTSNEVDFTLIPTVIYKTVTIGSQTWMKTNLDVDHYLNGDAIPQVTDQTQWSNLTTGAWCYYLNNDNYGPYYGKLYNWYALNDSRGVAPEGWRIPTDNDWMTLEKTIGMSQSEASMSGWRGTNEGNKLKEEGTDNWSSQNGGNNSSGFTALGGGYRTSDGFFNMNKDYGGWWSISISDNLTAWARTLKYSNSNIERMNYSKKCAFSVRCIKK